MTHRRTSLTTYMANISAETPKFLIKIEVCSLENTIQNTWEAVQLIKSQYIAYSDDDEVMQAIARTLSYICTEMGDRSSKTSKTRSLLIFTCLNQPPTQPTDPHLSSDADHVLKAVGSFRSGSASGLDGLSPQHLKDLLRGVNSNESQSLLMELTALINFMLAGKVNEEVLDIVYGANLCALIKKDGGIRPIAVGTTYRHLAAKICCAAASSAVGDYFQSKQLGFGSRGGCEAAELAAATPTERNWRGILIALLVIAAVLGLIVFSIVLLTPVSDGQGAKGRRPGLAQLFTDKYMPKPTNATWRSDEELVYRDRWGGLTLFNVRNFTTRLLMNNSTFRELNAVDFKVSPDLKFVLLVSDVKPGWRHARLARYHVYDIISRNKIPISPQEDDRTAPLLQYAEWSPAGSGLVFVHDNDIYYKPRVLKALVCRITNTGIPGVVFNGVPDFLYETEILRLDRALWFSPDGQQLMYATYNDTEVQEHRYPWYGLDLPEPPAYPSIKTLRYPKMNTKNPVVTIFVVSLKTPKFLFPHAIQFNAPVDKDWYVRWSSWLSERQVTVLLLNRPQNVSVITTCNAMTYNCQDIIRDETDGSRWSGLGAEPAEEECGWCGGAALVGGRTGVFTTAPVPDSDVGTWRHAVKVADNVKTPLTQGAFEITQILGWDERRRSLYLMGTLPDKAGERHLFRVALPGEADWPAAPRCLTCGSAESEDSLENDDEYDNMTSALPSWPTSTLLPHVADHNDSLPSACLYNRVIFSRNFSYYVHECLGPGPPATFLCDARGERLAVLWDGQPLRQRFQALAAPQAKVFKVEVQADRAARVRLLLPPGFRETDDLPLPLVLEVSAQPGAQLVTERWKLDWGWYLAASRNFIVAQIDASGSGGQGEDLRTEIYHKLLSADVEDQIAVLSYLRDNLKMVERSRVGAYGHGYGAAAAAALAADDARNVTRCVAALAPLTDLTHYNSYWTERYAGYGAAQRGSLGASAVWRRAGNLPPRRVLIAHGTADLTAPPDHALALARALVKAGAVYHHQVYPDEGHNFEKSNLHLHTTLEQFFDECFGPVELADWEVTGVGGLFPFRD